jgi:two-component system cell cycle sensor histidine kinase/response regulator CckA
VRLAVNRRPLVLGRHLVLRLLGTVAAAVLLAHVVLLILDPVLLSISPALDRLIDATLAIAIASAGIWWTVIQPLRRAQSYLRLIEEALMAASNAIVITDSAGGIEWVNPAFMTLTGYALNELRGRTPRVIKSPQTDAAIHAALWAAIAAGRVWRGELVNRRKDGTFYNQELTITPMRGEDNAVHHFIGVSQDVTTRRQLEKQLRQAQKMEVIGQLTGGIAHDFNNLLAVILGNTELLATAAQRLEPAARDDLEGIKVAAIRGAGMVKRLLGFSRLADLQLIPLDLGHVVREVAEMLRRLLPETVTVTIHVDDGIPPVRADVGAVEQVLTNLATNARDAMPRGGALGIEVSVASIVERDRALHPWVRPGEYVSIAVSDTGIGMDQQTQQRMFEPFFTTKPPGKGTGLGMAMIYGLTKQHSGFVHVYSELGRGTTVKTYFPVVRGGESTVMLGPARPLTELRGRGEIILLAEDEESLRRTGQRILERLGYRVLVAADGEEALMLYRSHQDEIALVISDLVMPKLGGRELYEAVREVDGHMRFILATGYSAGELRALAFAGPVRHLPKPWTLAEIAVATREILDWTPAAE